MSERSISGWFRSRSRGRATNVAQPLPVRLLATMIQGGQSGIYRYVHELTRRLEADDGVALEVDCLRDEGRLLADIHRKRYAPTWDRGGLTDLIYAQLLARPPDDGVLHVPSYRRVPWVLGERVVVTVHDLAPLHIPEKYGRARYALLKYFVPRGLERCAHILTVTEHTKRDLITRFGLDADKITVTPNGIDHRQFHPSDRESALARAQAVFPQLSRDFVLYVARIEHPGKGHVPLLEAWGRLRARYRDLPQLVFAGRAVERADQVLTRARELGIEPLYTSYVAETHIADLYRSCRLFVFPSLYEGFGLPPVEAMACGAPVASSRRGALSETAGPSACLEPDDPEQMADTLASLLDSSDQCARLSREGIRWAARFDWDQTTRRTLAVYRQVLIR